MSASSTFFADLRRLVVEPVLSYPPSLGLGGPAAVNLMLGTAAQESGGRALAQLGGGPALGLWQIEPTTHRDLLANFLPGRAAFAHWLSILEAPWPVGDEQLATNLNYACAVCRLIYLRAPEPLPDAADLAGLGAYWKAHYNTPAGAGTVDEFVSNFRTLIGDPIDA